MIGSDLRSTCACSEHMAQVVCAVHIGAWSPFGAVRCGMDLSMLKCVPGLILLIYPCFWKADNVDRPSLGNRRKPPISLYPLTFADKPFSCWIRHDGATSLTHTFHFRIVIMNPGFVNTNDTRKKSESSEIRARFSKHTEE